MAGRWYKNSEREQQSIDSQPALRYYISPLAVQESHSHVSSTLRLSLHPDRLHIASTRRPHRKNHSAGRKLNRTPQEAGQRVPRPRGIVGCERAVDRSSLRKRYFAQLQDAHSLP